MCLIAISPSGTALPTEETIRACWNANSDGAGVMWSDGEQVHIDKGFMRLKHLEKRLRALQRDTDTTAATVVVHFRIATAGGVNPACCHPFPVTDDLALLKRARGSYPLAVAHNGIVPIRPRTGLSDTMEYIASELALLAQMSPTWYESPAAHTLIERHTGSKWVILRADGQYQTIGAWHTDTQGITWSNYSYLSKPTTWHRASLDSLDDWWSDEWERDRPYVHCAPITSRLLVWLDSHTEQVVLPTGTIVDAEAFLMDREAAVYWFDPAQHAAAPVPGARVLATHRLTTTYNVADAEPFRIGKAIDMREPSTAPAR